MCLVYARNLKLIQPYKINKINLYPTCFAISLIGKLIKKISKSFFIIKNKRKILLWNFKLLEKT